MSLSHFKLGHQTGTEGHTGRYRERKTEDSITEREQTLQSPRINGAHDASTDRFKKETERNSCVEADDSELILRLQINRDVFRSAAPSNTRPQIKTNIDGGEESAILSKTAG